MQECGGRLGEIEEELKEAEKFEAVVAATSKTSKSNVLTEEKKLKQMEKSLSEVIFQQFYMLKNVKLK